MKKRLLFLAILGFNFHSLSASSVGNFADPAVLEEGFWIPDCSWASIRLGIGEDFLFDKRMSSSQGRLAWQLFTCDVGWNVRERWDLHLLVGPVTAVNLFWKTHGTLYETTGDQGIFWEQALN